MSVKYIDRTITKINENFIKVESLSHISGKKILRDVTGPFFRLIFSNILKGKFLWNIDGAFFSPSFNRLGMYIPPFSISEDTAIDCSNQGFMYVGEHDLEVFPLPILFDMTNKDFPTLNSLDEVQSYLRSLDEYTIIPRSSNPNVISNDLKNSISETFLEDIKLEQIAEALKISSPKLSKLFKKDFGMTPVQYRRALRVEYGLFLLTKGIPIVDAALMCGYNDLGRFYKQFKDVFYQSPGSLIKG